MARQNGNGESDIPIQPVESPIICNPYDEPTHYWWYDPKTGEASKLEGRRSAGYWYRTEKVNPGDLSLFAEEQRDDLTLVNLLREDVKRWRGSGYRGASPVTRELLRRWSSADLPRRLFFCQKEAVETMIYLAELRIPGKSSRTGFRNFALSDEDLRRLLQGERPSFAPAESIYFPSLVDTPNVASFRPLRRLGCKMATGSGKTVVMAMLIAWAFCNRGANPSSREYPHGVLVVCPNLTIKERLQVLRPESKGNYFEEFGLVPVKYRHHLQSGKVLIENWHRFLPESEHKEGDQSYSVVEKGSETPATFARRVLGDLYERMPIMVLNDEGHHCWRPAPAGEKLTRTEERELEEEKNEARVWLNGLDTLNNTLNMASGEYDGIGLCVDLSATPFHLKGSGYPEGSPFPWIVSDFGLVDAIESGIVKIPRLPVRDTTGRPDPKYFKLWQSIREGCSAAEMVGSRRSGRPKPEVVYREAEPALEQIAGQWVERFKYIQEAKPGQDQVPPVLIVVCDNTDIAKLFYERISGETEVEDVTPEEVEEIFDPETAVFSRKRKARKAKKRIVFGQGDIFPEYFSNTEAFKHTVRIDTKLLKEADSGNSGKSKHTAAEELRRIVSTVGKLGEPGEHVRCVVAVAMLNEGWDAQNVTNILGIRAFGSQLLCEQVVGRGLRRMDYEPDPETAMLTEEYVDVYGIPFSVIPFRGRPVLKREPNDKPKNHVRSLEDRRNMEIRFPYVDGYVFALHKNLIRCDIDSMDKLQLEPGREPTATFVLPPLGYSEGSASAQSGPLSYKKQDRTTYYQQTHLQAIKFQIARDVVGQLTSPEGTNKAARVLRLQSRHQLFSQVYRYVDEYIEKKVDFQHCHPCELGLKKYVMRIRERLLAGIIPDDAAGEPALLPVVNRYHLSGSSKDVDFKTTRPCVGTQHSHVNQVVLDTATWESSAAFWIEDACDEGTTLFYVRNDHLGLAIPYKFMNIDQVYYPDFLVRLPDESTLLLEIKGYEDEQMRAKHSAARRWVEAVSNWGRMGVWRFHVCRNPQLLKEELAALSGRMSTEPCSESEG